MRDGLVRAQTPQAVQRDILVAAFEATRGSSFSDEAALLESRGVPVTTVPGEAANIKVTEPGDLEIAARDRAGWPAAPLRFGLGQDSHGFGPDSGLWLGGVLIATAAAVRPLRRRRGPACPGDGGAGRGRPGRSWAGCFRPPTAQHAASPARTCWVLPPTSWRWLAGGWLGPGVARRGAAATGRRGIEDMAPVSPSCSRLDRAEVAIVASSGNLTGPEGAGRVINATALVGVHRR